MRAAELLRSLIDIIDKESEDKSVAPQVIINVNGQPQLQDEDKEKKVSDATGVFVPPLQQKIELLKKANGVQSVYDEAADEDEPFDG